MTTQKLPETLSQDAIDALYAFGFTFYEGGQYEKAMHFFRILTLVDIDSRKNWMGLGASYQMLGEHAKALESFGCAATLDPKDPMAHLHAAECFRALGLEEQAKDALESAEAAAKMDASRHKTLLARLALMNGDGIENHKNVKDEVVSCP